MTNIEQKALELVNEVCTGERGMAPYPCVDRCNDSRWEALCRAIEQHEAFRQEVSDAVVEYFDCEQNGSRSMLEVAETRLQRFIITKPDPLVDVINDADEAQKGWASAKDYAQHLRAALAKRGGRILFDD